MAAPTLTINASGQLEIADGTSGDPVTWNDVWNWDDGGGSSGGDGDVPIDGGGTAKVNTFMTETVVDAVYLILDDIAFGDGSTSSYFQSENEMVYFEDAKIFIITSNATLEIGDLLGDWGVTASMWRVKPTVIWDVIATGQTGIFKTYNCIFRTQSDVKIYVYGTWTARNFTLNGEGSSNDRIYFHSSATIDWKRCYVADTYGLYFYVAPVNWENVHCHSLTGGMYFYQTTLTLVTPYLTSIGSFDILITGAHTGTVKDPLFNISKPFILDASGLIIEQYTCNIHIADKDGADFQCVTIQCQTFGNVVSNDAGSTFYKCIVDHTAGIFADDITAGKWELTTSAYAALAGCTGAAQNGAWVTGIDYKKAASEFSVATDSDGDIAEQTIDYKKWIGTSEALLTHSPHTFTLTYGSDSHIVNDFTVDHPIVWHLEFLPIATTLLSVIDTNVDTILKKVKRLGPTGEIA